MQNTAVNERAVLHGESVSTDILGQRPLTVRKCLGKILRYGIRFPKNLIPYFNTKSVSRTGGRRTRDERRTTVASLKVEDSWLRV